MPVVHLENEVEFWQTRLTEILQIDTILNKVKKAQKNIDDLEIEYNIMRFVPISLYNNCTYTTY